MQKISNSFPRGSATSNNQFQSARLSDIQYPVPVRATWGHPKVSGSDPAALSTFSRLFLCPSFFVLV